MSELELVMGASKILAAIIGGFVFICFIAGLCGSGDFEPLKVPERFDLGYIDDPQPQPQPKPQQLAKPKPYVAQKVVQRTQEKKQNNTNRRPRVANKSVSRAPSAPSVQSGPSKELLRDCGDSLIALGTNRSEAHRVVSRFFVDNPNTSSVETFLTQAFKRRS
jgi:hypothetical protein